MLHKQPVIQYWEPRPPQFPEKEKEEEEKEEEESHFLSLDQLANTCFFFAFDRREIKSQMQTLESSFLH